MLGVSPRGMDQPGRNGAPGPHQQTDRPHDARAEAEADSHTQPVGPTSADRAPLLACLDTG